MNIEMSPFLRNTLYADAAMGAVAAAATIAGGGVLAPLLMLPQPLLLWAGIALVPVVLFLVAAARRPAVPRAWLREIVLLNAAWAAASIGILVFGLVQPNALGAAFVVLQAAAVALFAALEALPLRRGMVAA